MKKTFSRNLFWELISKLISIVSSFVVSRVILLFYGSDINGLVSSITNFLNIIAITDMGFSIAVQVALYGPLAKNDEKQISAVMVAASNFYRVIGSAIIAYIIILCIFFPKVIIVECDSSFVVQLIIVLGVRSVVEYLFGIVRTMILIADGKAYIINIANSFTNVLNIILCCMLTQSGYSIIIVKLATTLCFIIKPVVYGLYVRKNYNINWRACAGKIGQKWNGVAQHIAEYINSYADITVLSLFSTIINVSIYAVYNWPLTFCRQFLAIFSSSVRPVLGNYWALGKKEKYVEYFELYQFCINYIGTVVCGTVLIRIVPFVMLYTEKLADTQAYMVNSFASIVTIATYVRAYYLPISDAINSTGFLRQTQYVFIISAAINVVSSIVLVQLLGLDGVAWGTLISACYMMFRLSWFVYQNILQKNFGIFLRKFVKDMLIILGAFYFCKVFIRVDLVWKSWVIQSFGVVIIYIIWGFFMNYWFDRDNTIRVIHMVINRIKGNTGMLGGKKRNG